ncbi:MAG: trehalose-phosphatase [Deltaproteobacteria bacterium]|nr:trehalose-phosphatase [Deltaproteobacteria bacterium]
MAPGRLAAGLRARAPRWGFVLDHDGTLAPFRRDPSRAVPSVRARRAVARLLSAGHPVCIVSGRPLAFLRGAWPLAGLDLAGSHGAERAWEPPRGVSAAAACRRAARRLERAVRRALRRAPGGLFVESKPFGVAVHVRPLPPALRAGWLAAAERALRAGLPRGFRLLRGDCVVEARLRGADKGRVARRLRRGPARWRGLPLCAAGDDRTDEDLFAALGPRDVGVLVARRVRPSAARFRVAGVGELLTLLEAFGGGGKER